MRDHGGRRSGYQSPEAVLAEARRMAEDIRRRAERDAAAIRREAATWASDTRHEAEKLRDELLVQLEELERWTSRLAEDEPPPLDDGDEPLPEPSRTDGDVIDLRAAAEARSARDGGLAREIAPPSPAPAPSGPAPGQAPAMRREPIETSIETKVHDVVRLAVRRTFERVNQASSR